MASESVPQPAHLEPSPLGTKEYWDNLYETEISNHAADPSDLGTIWFDDSSAEDKILAFLHSPLLSLDAEHTSFLDIGTGNGHFLFRLREPFPAPDEDDSDSDPENDRHERDEGPRTAAAAAARGFKGRMVGTDYSQKSIEFALRIAVSRVPPVDPRIEFVHCDIMAPLRGGGEPTSHLLLMPPNAAGYDVVLDKGTFDAISLSDEALPGSGGTKRLCEGYKERILPLVREGGVFVVTSCNWTEEELRGWFEDEEAGLGFETAIKYRSFRFGGREGQSISSVCFRKRRRGS